MRLSTVLLVVLADLLARGGSSFSVAPLRGGSPRRSTHLRSTEAPTTDNTATPAALAKQNLLSVCERLKGANGVFIVDRQDRDALTGAVAELEAMAATTAATSAGGAPPPTQLLLGNWTLLCTAVTNAPAPDRSQLPAFLAAPLDDVRTRLGGLANRYLRVQQRIRADGAAASGDIARVDHVVEYAPPSSLKELLPPSDPAADRLPEALAGLSLNPLQVSKSKLVLIHKACAGVSAGGRPEVKLSLQSVVLNVAGTSAVLDPAGRDVAALNLPPLLADNELVRSLAGDGAFETTYLDDTLRVSRGRRGPVEQLRVFVRQTPGASGGDARVDVDDAVDPEFVYDDEAPEDAHEGQEDVSPSDY